MFRYGDNGRTKQRAQRRRTRKPQIERGGARTRESVVLTFNSAEGLRPFRMAARIGTAMVVTALISIGAATSAGAQGVTNYGCVGSWRSINCVTRSGPAEDPFVRLVPPPRDDSERARAVERERRWVDRCRPVIRADRYGVGRYRYAMPGCEFGATDY